MAGASYAQAPKKSAKQVVPPISILPQRNKAFHKSAIGGYFTDMRREPLKNVKAYVYNVDSTILASGYSDSAGYYETNSILPGMYALKITYPTSRFSVMLTGVPVLAGKITNISMLKAVAPEADTTIAYESISPKPAEKKIAKGGVKSAQ